MTKTYYIIPQRMTKRRIIESVVETAYDSVFPFLAGMLFGITGQPIFLFMLFFPILFNYRILSKKIIKIKKD